MSFTQSGTVATLAELRIEAAAAREIHEGLYSGDLTWHDWRPELTCGDRQAVAIDESWQEMREAAEALARAEQAAAA